MTCGARKSADCSSSIAKKGMWVNCDVKAALCNNNMTQDTKTSAYDLLTRTIG